MISRVWVAAAVALVGCAQPPPPPATRFTIPIAGDRAMVAATVSSDGRWLAYSAHRPPLGPRRIYIRSLADPAIDRELPDTIGGSAPFFSPDGRSVGYFARGWLWRSSVADSRSPQQVAEANAGSAGGTWTADGRIVFAPLGGSGLVEVPSSGGTPARLTLLARPDELAHGWPHALPDGSLFFTVSERGRDPHLEVLTREGTRTRLRVPIVGQAEFIDTGHLVYSYLGNLMGVRFNIDEREIVDVPVPLATGIQTTQGFATLGRAGFSVSRTGTLAWFRATPDDARTVVVRVTNDGTVTPFVDTPQVYQTPRFSPDGRRLAVVVRSGVMTRDIRILDAAKPERVVLIISGGDNQSPAWMDDRRITFSSNRDGGQKIYVAAVAGNRPAAPLFAATTTPRNPASWSRPPRVLALYEIAQGRNVLVYRVGESIAPAAATSANERSPSVSYDGSWLAYVSDARGADDTLVTRLDRTGFATLLTLDGATEPVWSGRGLHYRQNDRMVLRSIENESVGEPRVLFEGYFEWDPGSNAPAYDVTSDGRTFVMLRSALRPPEIRIVRNWGTELRRMLP